MSKVIIPLNAFPSEVVLSNGQASFVDNIAQSGADGIEIRRELFPVGNFPLEEIRSEIDKYNLFTVYSAPIELWNEDGTLNKSALHQTFEEAKVLGASWLKVSLGHYQEKFSNCNELNRFLETYDSVKLTVENDQTMYGGNVGKLAAFFKCMNQQNSPVKMTFDIGNWYYTGQDVQNALLMLANYVCYIHLKQVEKNADGLITLPLSTKKDAEWRKILCSFPANLVRALEFPMELHEIQMYKEMVQPVQ